MIQSTTMPDFLIPLGQSAHQQAEQFSRMHSLSRKVEQVYLNTLAVYAVNYYIKYLGFTTALASSNSWNPALQALSDVADLMVQDYGRLECRPIDAETATIQIPPEVWQDRIGYLMVELDELLESARLIGFLDRVAALEIPLAQLQPLDQLSAYLSQFRQTSALSSSTSSTSSSTNLSQWLAGQWTAGWQMLEAVLTYPQPEPIFAFRNSPETVTRSRRIQLEQEQAAIAMVVTLTPTVEEEIEIRVEVIPADGEPYLPANLQLTLLDEQGETVINAQTREENQRMRLEFTGTIGDQFSIRVTAGQFSITENFIV